LFEGLNVVPDFRHVPNPVSVELHRVHIVRDYGLACRRIHGTRAGLRTVEHSERRDDAAPIVGRERLQFVATIREWRQQVLIQSVYPCSVPISASASAWQEKVASSWQYGAHSVQP
jgi:hypothetical protein